MRASRFAVLAAALLAACGGSSSGPVCPQSFDDGNACTTDACDPATGEVTHTPVATNDGNACTVDACDPATGVSHTPVATDDGNACTTDACNPASGVTHAPVATDDGNACTTDACDPGSGVSHTPVATDDGNGCTTDACDPGSGVSHTPVATDDGDACTTDACNPASGVTHTPVATDDGNACTTDACDPASGVSHTPVATDDGNACTTDACDPASGVSHTPVATDDGDACTTDACNVVTGVITHTPVAIDDADACTIDACNSATGAITHTPKAMDDGDACTIDACNPATGAISHDPVAIDDADACTTDACDPASGVSHTPVAIDDGDACTADACNPITGVSHTPIPTDDGVGCTIDACDPATGVSHAPDDAVCAPGGYCDPLADCVYPALASFEPALSFVYVGQTDVSTIPTPLTVRLSAPPRDPTFVTVGSYDANRVTVTGGGVTIQPGQTSAPVLVSGVGAGPVGLYATLDTTTLYATVRVVDPAHQPALTALSASTVMVTPGAIVTFTVELDIPAVPGGTVVTLAVEPADAGFLPATVTVPEGRLSATFDYVDGGLGADATVTASLGASSLSRTLRAPGLLINEVDYDQPSIDFDEFIEIYNPTSAAYDLTGVVLYLVNGADAVPPSDYLRFPLSGRVEAGAYALVATTTVVASPGLRFDFALGSNNVQNGAPDAIVLIHEPTQRVLDAVTYEGQLGPMGIGTLGTFAVMETAPAIADLGVGTDSLCRAPDGQDTDDNSADFSRCTAPTPGAPNVTPP